MVYQYIFQIKDEILNTKHLMNSTFYEFILDWHKETFFKDLNTSKDAFYQYIYKFLELKIK